MGSEVPWKRDVRIKAVVHGHLGEHVVRDAHPPVVMELLRRIPGVEVVAYADTPALQICDNAGVKIRQIGTDEYRAMQAELEDYLVQMHADTLVTMYHSCTRELSKFASDKLRWVSKNPIGSPSTGGWANPPGLSPRLGGTGNRGAGPRPRRTT
jgi:hypothetical protein